MALKIALLVLLAPFAIALSFMQADQRRDLLRILPESKESKRKRLAKIEQGDLADLAPEDES
jgi:hypothetical protein